MQTVFISSKVAFVIFDGMDNTSTKTLSILLWCNKKGTTHEIVRIDDRHRRRTVNLPMIRRVSRNRVVTRFDDRGKNWFVIERIKTKIAVIRIKCGANIGTVNDFTGVVRKDLESHGMTNMFSDTNPTTASLARVRREIRVINLVIDRLVPPKKTTRD
jgi:hypothetical protein